MYKNYIDILFKMQKLIKRTKASNKITQTFIKIKMKTNV